MNSLNTSHAARVQLKLTRVFKAPLKLVFECWTQPAHMEKWLFPKDFTVPFSDADIRSGGSYRSCLREPNGPDHWVGGTYIEVTPYHRILFTHAWQDEVGNSGHETVVTITLKEVDASRTELTLHQAFFESGSSRDGHAEGWDEAFDNLERYLAA